MNFEEILTAVLKFAADYHLWIMLGLFVLFVFTWIVGACVSGSWKRKYKKLTTSYVNETNKNKTLKASKEELTKELEEQTKVAKTALDENAELKEKETVLATKVEELSVALEELESSKNTLKEAEDTLKSMNELNSELIDKFNSSDTENIKLRNDIEVLSADLSKRTAEIDALHKEIDTYAEKIEVLEFDLKVANEHIAYHMSTNEALIKTIKEVSTEKTVTKTSKKKVKKVKTEEEKLASMTRAELIKIIERNPESAGTSYKRLSKQKLVEMITFLRKKK